MALGKIDGSYDTVALGLNVRVRYTVYMPEEHDGPGFLGGPILDEWEVVNPQTGEEFGDWFYTELEESGEEESLLDEVQEAIKNSYDD